MEKLTEVLSTLGGRIGWDTWGLPYRLGVALGAVLLAYWAVRAVIPATFRLLRPLVFLAAVAVAVAALFPGQSCQVDWIARVAPFCGRS
jgi:hypothetical protein